MLRCATITEAQAADRQIWSIIRDIMSERGWSLDDTLHEVTHIRHDLPALLQLRPRPPRILLLHLPHGRHGKKDVAKDPPVPKEKAKANQKGKLGDRDQKRWYGQAILHAITNRVIEKG